MFNLSDFETDFADFSLPSPRNMSLDSLWSHACPTTSTTWTSPFDQVLPTPPRSPSIEPEEILGLSSPFSTGTMVDPNSILDETSHHRTSDPTLDSINLGFPLLDDIDIKIENFDSYLNPDDFLLNEPLCAHGFSSSFCNCCFEDNFKTEIVNDCMWGTTTPILDDKKQVLINTSVPISPSTTSVFTKVSPLTSVPPRPRFDSMSSRYSDISDPLAVPIADMDCDLHYNTNLDTPSESSDTDEGPIRPDPVHVDHNYHSSNKEDKSNCKNQRESEPHKSQSPKPKSKLKVKTKPEPKLSMAEPDSDDEIDVVSWGPHDPPLNSLPRIHGCFTIRGIKDQEVRVPAKRGRKPGSTTVPRKVGRPCKNPKRTNTKEARPSMGRRPGSRSVTMDPHKRNLHNSMERMRRVDLKNCFDAVRCNVPALRDRARAPKVLILKSAAELVRNLEKGELKKRQELDRLNQYQKLLLIKIQRLKEEQAGAMEKEFG